MNNGSESKSTPALTKEQINKTRNQLYTTKSLHEIVERDDCDETYAQSGARTVDRERIDKDRCQLI